MKTHPLLIELKPLMIAKHLTVATAESLTCGRLQAALGSISGSSNFFEGGITVYNPVQKIRLLGVDERHAKGVDSVSQLVAFSLAKGACRMFGSDIGLGATGYAEPAPDHGALEPLAYSAICRQINGHIEHIAWACITGPDLNRLEMQERVVDSILRMLQTYVENLEEHTQSPLGG